MKKYLALIFISLIALGAYLYNYSLNVHVQKFRIYTHLYFNHQNLTELAESILLKPNVKEVGYKYGAVRAEYFQSTPIVTEVELNTWESKLKKHSLLFAKIRKGEVFFHAGSIPYKSKTVLVGIVYKSPNDYSDNCLTEIKELPEGKCHERYNRNWLIKYFWHPSFFASQT